MTQQFLALGNGVLRVVLAWALDPKDLALTRTAVAEDGIKLWTWAQLGEYLPIVSFLFAEIP